jgi:integrase/recombinase XerD
MTGSEGQRRRCLPVEQWPAPDREAWVAAHRRGGLLEEDGLAANWAHETNTLIAAGYGRFLSYLAQVEDLAPQEAPASRITRARVEAYVAELRWLNHSSTVAARLQQLERAASVMAPAAGWGWLRRLKNRLSRLATPARDDRARLPPGDTLLKLAMALMQRGEGESGTTLQKAIWFRDGLMIAVLCFCAPRARNLAGTVIAVNLQRRGDGWWLYYGPHETKTHRPIELPLPECLNSSVARYLAHHRPRLTRLTGDKDAMWLSRRGRPFTRDVGKVIAATTRRELGKTVNPHLFRKLIPTELAIHDPEHVGVSQAVLGHADYRITERAYNMARALDAARRYQVVLASLQEPQQEGRGVFQEGKRQRVRV